jgi:ABC-type nitrate/sulfonate/bicarbonate transport system permease component
VTTLAPIRGGVMTPARLRWLTVAALVFLWEAGVRVLGPNEFVARPTDVPGALVDVLGDGALRGAIGVTAQEYLVAWALASVGGVALGATLSLTRRAYRSAQTGLQVLFTLPQVTIYPLFVLWLGIGFNSKVAFGVTHAIFPIALATLAASREADRTLMDAVRSMGGGRWAVLRLAVIPGAWPRLLAGLRIGASLALVGVLLGELMVSTAGVGSEINRLTAALAPAKLDALILIVCLIACAVNTALGLAERRVGAARGTP